MFFLVTFLVTFLTDSNHAIHHHFLATIFVGTFFQASNSSRSKLARGWKDLGGIFFRLHQKKIRENGFPIFDYWLIFMFQVGLTSPIRKWRNKSESECVQISWPRELKWVFPNWVDKLVYQLLILRKFTKVILCILVLLHLFLRFVPKTRSTWTWCTVRSGPRKCYINGIIARYILLQLEFSRV